MKVLVNINPKDVSLPSESQCWFEQDGAIIHEVSRNGLTEAKVLIDSRELDVFFQHRRQVTGHLSRAQYTKDFLKGIAARKVIKTLEKYACDIQVLDYDSPNMLYQLQSYDSSIAMLFFPFQEGNRNHALDTWQSIANLAYQLNGDTAIGTVICKDKVIQIAGQRVEIQPKIVLHTMN